MNIEDFRNFCLNKPGVTEGTPFDHCTLVFKVMNKMFALANMDNFLSTNLKCDPERAIELREQYHGVRPGFHMNKKHWNTVHVDQDVSWEVMKELVDHSYGLVVSGLTKKAKEELKSLENEL
ncbi:MAG: MmcQ/YjbR family DNA-binding protein [Reichenbachiella sp.]